MILKTCSCRGTLPLVLPATRDIISTVEFFNKSFLEFLRMFNFSYYEPLDLGFLHDIVYLSSWELCVLEPQCADWSRCFWLTWETGDKSTNQLICSFLQLRDSLHQVIVALLQLVHLLLCSGLHWHQDPWKPRAACHSEVLKNIWGGHSEAVRVSGLMRLLQGGND